MLNLLLSALLQFFIFIFSFFVRDSAGCLNPPHVLLHDPDVLQQVELHVHLLTLVHHHLQAVVLFRGWPLLPPRRHCAPRSYRYCVAGRRLLHLYRYVRAGPEVSTAVGDLCWLVRARLWSTLLGCRSPLQYTAVACSAERPVACASRGWCPAWWAGRATSACSSGRPRWAGRTRRASCNSSTAWRPAARDSRGSCSQTRSAHTSHPSCSCSLPNQSLVKM